MTVIRSLKNGGSMRYILSFLVLVSVSLSAYDIREMQQKQIEADYLFERGLFGSSLLRYNQICFDLCPDIMNVEKRFQEMSVEEKKVLIDAWHGRLASLSVLGQVNGYHIREKRILDKLDESTVKTIDDGDYTIVENLGEFTEEELDEFSDELLEKGLIESKNDMSYEDGKIRVKIKPEKPCCDGCAEEGKKK
jgi:hypothetical protein